MKRLLYFTAAALIAVTQSSAAVMAADTTETFDKGFSDFEFYAGYSGFGEEERSTSSEFLLGAGITDRFSVYISSSVESDRYLNSAATEKSFGFGFFGTVVDTNHFDLDLMLDVTSFETMTYTPALEINIDSNNDMSFAGLYFRVEETAEGNDEDKIVYTAVFTTGAYYTINDMFQMLVEYDFSYNHEEEKTSKGGVAVGLNIAAMENIELINQVYYDIPDSGEDAAWGASIGFIASL